MGNKNTKDVQASSPLEQLCDSMLLKILDFNLDRKDLISLKSTNKRFYLLLNPNQNCVNLLWERMCRNEYSLIPNYLKCKRWDLYYKFRLNTLKANQMYNKEHIQQIEALYSTKAASFVNIIEGCDYDINEINNQFDVKVVGNKIIKRIKKKNSSKTEKIFKGKIGSNGLPKGFKYKLQCPMVLAGNWGFLYPESKSEGIYFCNQCEKKVYTVQTLNELETKLKEKKCVRIVYCDPNQPLEYKVYGSLASGGLI
eukprot:114385_1